MHSINKCLFSFILLALSLSVFSQSSLLDDAIRTSLPELSFQHLDNKVLTLEAGTLQEEEGINKFAEAIEIQISPETHGSWIETNGTSVWAIALSSATARSLNLGFNNFYLPTGASLVLYSDPSKVYGPFDASDNEVHKQFWSPVIPGDRIYVELQVPTEYKTQVQLEINYLNHDFLGFGVPSGSCNLDVVCSEIDGWARVDEYHDIIRSVAVISLGGGTFCTGFLVNSMDGSCSTPYFMTADHCGVDQGNAASLVAYWNYENSICRQPDSPESGQSGDGTLDVFNSGSFFRAGYGPTDVTLVQLDDPVVEEAEAFLAGWTLSETPPDSVIGIHHPATDEKRISFMDNGPSYIGEWGQGADEVPNGNHVIVPDWDIGTTEPGSSGSPLFDTDHRVIGQLHGGGAACGNDLYDSYGWFFKSWIGGGSPNTRLMDWLDPSQEDPLFINGLDCAAQLESSADVLHICSGDEAEVSIIISQSFGEDLVLDYVLSDDDMAYDVNNEAPESGDTLQMTIETVGLSAGNYSITVSADDGNRQNELVITVIVYEGPASVDLTSPLNENDGEQLNVELDWTSQNAQWHDIQVALDEEFQDLIADESDLTQTDYLVEGLTILTKYYWRVRGGNPCRPLGDWTETWTFETGQILCPSTEQIVDRTIYDTLGVMIVDSIFIPFDILIADVNVYLKGTHTWLGDLEFFVESPEGTTVSLINQQCGDVDNFDIVFDDDAGSLPPCPYNDGQNYRPAQDLSAFNSENTLGFWKIYIIDHYNNDGGIFDLWSIDFCGVSAEDALILADDSELFSCGGDTLRTNIMANSGWAGMIDLSVVSAPGDLVVSFEENPIDPLDEIEVTLGGVLSIPPYSIEEVIISATDGNFTEETSIFLYLDNGPEPANLISPNDGATNVSLQPSFEWFESNGTDNYRLDISDVSDMQNVIYTFETSDLMHDLAIILENNTEYWWRITSEGPCGPKSISNVNHFTTDFTDAISTIKKLDAKISPNPATDAVKIDFGGRFIHRFQLDLLGASGTSILTKRQLSGSAYDLDLNGLEAGCYFLQIKSENGILSEKIIIEQ